MKAECRNGMLIFSGRLTEETTVEQIIEILQGSGARARQPDSTIAIDLSNVLHANSSGLWNWIKAIQSTNTALTYHNCPVWLVEQFNLLDDLLEGVVKVASFHAPFYHEERDEVVYRALQVGKDVPLLKDYDDFECPHFEVNGVACPPDFLPESYFYFMTRLHHQ